MPLTKSVHYSCWVEAPMPLTKSVCYSCWVEAPIPLIKSVCYSCWVLTIAHPWSPTCCVQVQPVRRPEEKVDRGGCDAA